ncbi:MAG: FRG domain-containing protein [Candidatus Sumerlaeaceae bacterium]
MNTEQRVKSWSELNDLLFGNIYDNRLGRHRSSFAYRGLCRPFEELRTSIMGLGQDPGDIESHLLRNFRKYARRDAVAVDTVWDWLALAQHHGVPTRMLDWSFSPDVALHFATADTRDFSEDGVVWCVDYAKSKEHLPSILKKALQDEGSDVFTAELLNRVAQDLGELEKLDKKAFPVFLEPPSLDDRIVNQSALFSLMSRAGTTLHEWLKDRPELCRRIVLPAELKWEVRDKLDQAGVTERVLFPGLDGLSRWLKRYYSVRK